VLWHNNAVYGDTAKAWVYLNSYGQITSMTDCGANDDDGYGGGY
jgi:hypothetical protein